MTHAKGTFDVKVLPQKADNPQAEAAGLSRMAIDKRFHGDLEAVSTGEMLATGDPKNSAAYVALEKVTGKLNGRAGTFVLQHDATMIRGAGTLTVKVVPELSTGELTGLTGEMKIEITGGKHYYDFAYSLPEKK